MKFVGVEEAYENLAIAIIKSAADDYVTAYRRAQRGSKVSEGTMKSIERFFRSEYYSNLTDVDGEVLITMLREKAEHSQEIDNQ